jgi:hypothetical protein
MAFTSLGLAGILVTSILPSLIGGSAASAPGAIAQQPAASSAAGATDAAGGLYGYPLPAATTGSEAQFGPQSRPSAVPISAGSGGGKSNDQASSAPDLVAGEQANRERLTNGRDSEQLQSSAGGPSPIVIGSLVLLVVGLALFGLRFLARRAA